MGCISSKSTSVTPVYLETAILASETCFTLNEVEALYVLYKELCNSIVDDGMIRKEELQLALLGDNAKKNLFLDRVFALFDANQNGAIEFGDFVRSISIFHPKASQAAKIEFAFNLFDMRHTGYIEREELKEMVVAILEELTLVLSDEIVDAMLDKTLMEVDTKGDGKIDREEWEAFVARKPSIMKIMTLECLKEVTITFPSFVMNSQVQDSDLAAAPAGEDGNHRLYSNRVVPSKSSDGMEGRCLGSSLKDHKGTNDHKQTIISSDLLF